MHVHVPILRNHNDYNVSCTCRSWQNKCPQSYASLKLCLPDSQAVLRSAIGYVDNLALKISLNALTGPFINFGMERQDIHVGVLELVCAGQPISAGAPRGPTYVTDVLVERWSRGARGATPGFTVKR